MSFVSFLVQLLLRIEGVLLGCQEGVEIYPTVIVAALNTLTRMLSEGRVGRYVCLKLALL